MCVRTFGDVLVVDSGLACDTFNLICGTPSSLAVIDDAIASFAGRPFSWWLDGAANELLATVLEPAESELAMRAQLAEVPLFDAPSLRIERVRTREQLRAFARVSAANWSPPDEHVIEFYERTATAALRDDSPLRFYLGTHDAVPVATAEMTVSGATAGLYNIATLASARGRGFGSAMTTFPLAEARREGCTTAVLQASADGVGIYRRAGFVEVGTITEYKPR